LPIVGCPIYGAVSSRLRWAIFAAAKIPFLPARPGPPGLKRYLIELVWRKIKLEKVKNFQRSNKRHLRTTIHHTITTISPANYHQKTHHFPETPLKNARKTPKTATQPPRIFFVKFEPKIVFGE